MLPILSRRQSGDLLGDEAQRLAASGDLMAQRSLVAAALVPDTVGGVLPADRMVVAEMWARIAVANGDMQDVMRLVHILGLKETYLKNGSLPAVRGDQTTAVHAAQAEALALLAVIADSDDISLSLAACDLLSQMLRPAVPGNAIVRLASDLLRSGGHSTPSFDGMVAELSPPPCVAGEAVHRRAASFDCLVSTLQRIHGVDRAAAELLVTGTPDYAPDLLDSKAGWDSIVAAVALVLGDAPPVAATEH